MRFAKVFSWTGLVLVLCAGCQNKLADERDQLYKQNQELQSQLNDAKGRPSPAGDQAQVRTLQEQLVAKDAEIARLKATPVSTGNGASAAAGLEGMDTTYDAKAGTLTVNLQGDVLFDSGKAELKASARATLDKIVAALNKQYIGKPVRVEGHTDNDPITRTREQWDDNLELSLARAATVTRYLEKAGLDPKRVATTGFGENKPKGGDKRVNRRVEIVVVMK